jgi:hypothetical protein
MGQPRQPLRDFSTHKLDKIDAGGDGKKKYTARGCEVHVAHKKQSETGYICELYVVPLHRESCFETYHLIRYSETPYMQFLQYWVQKYHVHSPTVII